jgi:adhesin transport system membrane fusion protein
MKFIQRNNKGSSSEGNSAPIIVWITALTLIILTVWAGLSEIEQVTRAQGQVIPSSRTQIIQSLDGGTLIDIPVREGDKVVKGQLLARMDPTKPQAAYRESLAKTMALRATKARLQSEIDGSELVFPAELSSHPQFLKSQRALMQKRQSAINEDIRTINEMKAMLIQELDMTRPLLKTGDVSATDVLRLQRQITDLQSQINNKQNKYLQDLQLELSKVEEDLASAEQILLQRKDILNHLEIRSPANGIVKNVRVTTLGGVLKPSEEVMQIVPIDDTLIVEVKVKPADIAFIKPKLSANVKIDAYDYLIYGALKGTVTYISADTLTEDLRQGEQAYYRVQIQTTVRTFSGRPNETFEIQPGMTATAEIVTGHSTVLRYLFKPVIKTVEESLGER